MHGWLNLDKPLRLTSAQAVARVKKIMERDAPRVLKIGHAGTLDPLASGILPLALGEATKTVAYAMDAEKTYRFTVSWGEARETDDAEGEITETSPVRPSEAQIRQILPQFIGAIDQVPPAYSALKVGGQRAYALARAGRNVPLAPRPVTIKSIELKRVEAGSATFAVSCGKGTYIRSLARDMAVALGTVGHVSALRRTRVGSFAETNAISLEMLEKMVHKGTLASVLQPVESVLDDIPAREVDSALAARLRQGQAIYLENAQTGADRMVRLRCDGRLVAIASAAEGMMKPVRVFNL